MMKQVTFGVANLSKTFNRKSIFSGISFELSQSGSIIIAGRNGSGKSTLLKILIGVLSQTKGTITTKFDGNDIPRTQLFRYLGFVSPYLQMYDEFTAWENLQLVKKIRSVEAEDEYLKALLSRVNLTGATHQQVRTFSSGMKQRLKYAFALLHQPPILILDEPTANLDQEGKGAVHAIVREQRERGIAIIASNEPDEMAWGDSILNLDEFKGPAKGGKQ